MLISDSAPLATTGTVGAPPLASVAEAAGSVSPVAEVSGAGTVPAGESCPPPLVWQEVLAAYHSESQPWEVNVGRRRLVGRTWGQGPPLYLLNGFAATSEMYALMMWLLRDTFRCVVFDTVGTGARGCRPAINDYAADLIAAADRQGDASIHLFGPSFGAAVAMNAALDNPDRITRLVLQHGFARRRLSWFERQLAFLCGLSSRKLAALPGRRRIQELNHRRWFPPFDGTRFEFLVESTGRIALSDLADRARAVHAFDIESRLLDIPCPVLLIRTEGQGRLEADGHEVLERNLRNARTEWMHSSGLHPYLTHPHRLAKLLKAYLLPDESAK